ncbi:MAG: glycoside hydrolase family 3 N-terminal domain-containing protein [Archangium sp.]|nr:glycoside hydrolase family 3 N-terminal domain-containing protein [Archangium sp.]
MRRAHLVTALLLAACSSNPNPDGGVGGGGGAGGGDGGGAGGGQGGGGGGVAECDKPANEVKRQQLLASQPALEAKKKAVLTVDVTFASVADDPSTTCSVQLRFKDSNGSGTLDLYEDWRQTPAARATDLLAKLSVAQKLGLMAHGRLTDVPGTNPAPSAATLAMVGAHLRFGQTSANTATVAARATWANALQEACEESGPGIPFLLSSMPAHAAGNGRVKARQFSQWPNELSLAASNDAALVEAFAKVVSQEYRAIGVRMALSVPADLATDPRWFDGQFTFGEDSAAVSGFVAAYVKGLQGAALGPESVAAVVGSFPGAGAAKGGLDARLAKGRYLAYPGNGIDAHLAPFQRAIEGKVAGVSTALGIPEAGAWTGLSGALDGATLEQVSASLNGALLTDVLRTRFQHGGLVLAPASVLTDTPWGVESLSRAARVGKAAAAGVDQFLGLDDPGALTEAKTAGLLSDAQLDASAGRALALLFQLGLFEDPYVDAVKAPQLTNTDAAYRAGLDAMNRGLVLLVNATKPSTFLNGAGDGTQTGDKGNAGNGTLKVLPAPPGEPYVSAGCAYYIMGDFDLDYVRSVSAGYGELTNDSTSIKGVPVSTAAERIALSDYVFIRVAAPFTKDADSGALNLPTPSLEYAGAANAEELNDILAAKAAISAWTGSPASQTQIIVSVDAGRLPVVSELLALGVSGLYVQWNGVMPGNQSADKVMLDVAFGIAHGVGKLPAGLPLSNAAVEAQQEDLPGDGQHPVFIRGFGLTTPRFE